MAGKFEYGAFRRLNRAYAEGRAAAFTGGASPHVANSPADLAWDAGYAATGADSTAYTGRTASPYNAVRFDGTNDSLSRGANLSNMPAAPTTFTFAAQIKFNSLATIQRLMAANSSALFDLSCGASGVINLQALDGTGLVAGWATIPINTVGLAQDVWYTIHVAANTSTGSNGRLRAWIDGVSTLDNAVSGEGSGALDWDTQATNWRIGINAAGTGGRLNADVRFIWFDIGQEVTDPTAFTTGDLGTDGTGTGLTRPLVYYTGAAAVWNAGTNGGDGGNFTAAGSITDA